MPPDRSSFRRPSTRLSKARHQALAQTTYFDDRFHRDAVKLLPGEFFYTDADPVLVTVLGSCVAACIRDTRSGIGGMNHFMLPVCENPGSAQRNDMIYGEQAIDVLIEHLLNAGAKFENLEAKIFGGGHIVRSMIETDIGNRNSKFAVEQLRKLDIPVLAQDLGGNHARKLYFFPATGQALVRKLDELANDTLQKRDRDYAAFTKPKLR